jgi:hypothetical protein
MRATILGLSLASILFAGLVGGVAADEQTDACIAAPTRACILEAALSTGASAQDTALRASDDAIVAAAQGRYGLRALASKNLARAIEAAKAIPEPQGDRPRASIAIAHAEAGDFASALAEARSIKTVESRIFALNGVGAASQRAGRADDAASSFEQAIGAAQSLAGAKQLNQLILIAESQASVGLPNATVTYDLALKTAKAQNSIFFPTVIASLRANSGEIVEALRDALSIEESDKSIALAAIVNAQLKAGRIADASELASGIDYDEERLHALVAVAVAQARTGKVKEATDSIMQAQSVAASIRPERRAVARAEIAGAQAAAGLAMDSAAGVDEAREALAKQTQPSDRDPISAAIALALARSGQIPKAIELALTLSSEINRSSSLEDIADDEAAAKSYGDALRALLSIPIDDRRTNSMIELAAKAPS